MSNEKEKEIPYLLLDSENVPLLHVYMESDPADEMIRVRMLEDRASVLQGHELFRLLGTGRHQKPIQCRLMDVRGERVLLKRLFVLNHQLRDTLRVPMHLKSFVYPVSGEWKGRKVIHSVDLSCGGIAFYGEAGLQKGEVLEVVLPIEPSPLIVHGEILRIEELQKDRALYAARFVDLCQDEENAITEAVFSIQLEEYPRKGPNQENE